MSVNVVINFQASGGRADELLPLLQQGRDISRAAEGCESFDLFQREDDDHRFMFLEQWDSIEHDANWMVSEVTKASFWGHRPTRSPPQPNSTSNPDGVRL